MLYIVKWISIIEYKACANLATLPHFLAVLPLNTSPHTFIFIRAVQLLSDWGHMLSRLYTVPWHVPLPPPAPPPPPQASCSVLFTLPPHPTPGAGTGRRNLRRCLETLATAVEQWCREQSPNWEPGSFRLTPCWLHMACRLPVEQTWFISLESSNNFHHSKAD